MRQPLRIFIACIVACGTLVGCSAPQMNTVPSPTETPANAQSSAAQRFDSGNYTTEFAKEGKPAEDLEAGYGNESFFLGNSMPSGFELHDKLNGRGGSRLIFGAPNFSNVAVNAPDALKPLEQNMMSGFSKRATSKEDSGLSTLYSLVRYDSPEHANEARNALYKAILEQSDFLTKNANLKTEYYDISPPKAQPTTAPGLKNAKASTLHGDTYEKLEVIDTHNEFMMYAQVSTPLNSLDELSDFPHTWMTQQVEILDEIEPDLHKLKSGFGGNDGWISFDHDDILRYSPRGHDADERNTYPLPQVLDQKHFASKQYAPEEFLGLTKAAGIKYFSGFVNLVGRAQNAEGAEAFRSGWVSIYEREGFEQYDDPQNLPGTTCFSKLFTDGRERFECIQVYEDLIAITSSSLGTFQQMLDLYRDERLPRPDETKESLIYDNSQKMAAQLKIFENAKVNKEGKSKDEQQKTLTSPPPPPSPLDGQSSPMKNLDLTNMQDLLGYYYGL